MTELVLNLTRFGFKSEATVQTEIVRQKTKINLSEVLFIGITLIALQMLDGFLTAIGVFNLGYNIEANFIIRNLMISWGVVPALVAVKTIAVAIIASLCHIAITVDWVATALRGIIVLYLSVAIVPWAAVLAFRIL